MTETIVPTPPWAGENRWPEPGEWFDWLAALAPEQRVERLEVAFEAMQISRDCFQQDHVSRIRSLEGVAMQHASEAGDLRKALVDLEGRLIDVLSTPEHHRVTVAGLPFCSCEKPSVSGGLLDGGDAIGAFIEHRLAAIEAEKGATADKPPSARELTECAGHLRDRTAALTQRVDLLAGGVAVLGDALEGLVAEWRTRQRSFEPSGTADAYFNAASALESVIRRFLVREEPST